MKRIKTKRILSFILAFVMTVSLFSSLLVNQMVQAAESQAVTLETGAITWNGVKAQVYISNAAEVAKNSAWYSGIYDGTATKAVYFAGKVQVNGENYTTSIWVPGDQGTSGLIQFDLGTSYDGTSDFTIPAGTVFTCTTEGYKDESIIFSQEYMFDVSSSVVYPTDISSKAMTLYKYVQKDDEDDGYDVDGGIMAFQIGNVVDLPNGWYSAEWNPETGKWDNLPELADCPTFQGTVQVTTAEGTETKSVKMLVRGHGEVWFYVEDAGITTGTVTISPDEWFYPTNRTTAVQFATTYTIDVDNKTLTYDSKACDITLQTENLSVVNSKETTRYIYLSNAAELAANADASWYKEIYEWTAGSSSNLPAIYLSGKVMLDGTAANAEICIYGTGQTTGKMHIEVYGNNYDGTKNYHIPAGTVFTKVTGRDSTGWPTTWDESVQIQFSDSYTFDVESAWVYPSDADIQRVVLSGYNSYTDGVDSIHVWSDLSTITWITDLPELEGTVEVNGEQKPVTLQIPSQESKTVSIYSQDAGITSGEYVLKRGTVFIFMDANEDIHGIRVPRDYTVDITKGIVTHERDVVELDATYLDTTYKRFNTSLKNSEEEMELSYWYTSTATYTGGETDQWNTASGMGVDQDGNEINVTVKVHQDGQLFFYCPENVTSIEFPKGTVFTFSSVFNDANVTPNSNEEGNNVVLTFKMASNYKFDVTNRTLIHQETLTFSGINWKGRSPAGYDYLNVDNGGSSFDDLIWYQECYDKVEGRETVIVTGPAYLGHENEETQVTLQVQDLGRFTFRHDNVIRQCFQIEEGACFTSDVSGSNGKKRYEFTFTEGYELDAATKYLGTIGGQSDTLGNTNGDVDLNSDGSVTVNVIDLIHMVRFVDKMDTSIKDDLLNWVVSYGADADQSGTYDQDDIVEIMNILTKPSS